MRIEILDDAKEDLTAGYHFYEEQSAGLGSYFLDSIYSDIIRCFSMQEFTSLFSVRIDAWLAASHLPFITVWKRKRMWCGCELLLIVAVIRLGFLAEYASRRCLDLFCE